MSSVKSFNKLLRHFLRELVATFPDDTNIRTYKSSFDVARKTLPLVPFNVWKESVLPLKEKILNKDESFILEDSVTILPGLDLAKLWGSADEKTKKCIWDYITQLTVLSEYTPPSEDEMRDMVNDAIRTIEDKDSETESEDGMSSIANLMQGFMKDPNKGAELETLMKSAQSLIANIDEEKIMNMAASMGFVDKNSKEIDETKIMSLVSNLPQLMKTLGTKNM